MPPIELNPVRAIRAADPRQPRSESERGVVRGVGTPDQTSVQLDPALSAGQPPINQERVAEIRKAIEQGRYPMTPMRVADAMIAAGFLWRAPQ